MYDLDVVILSGYLISITMRYDIHIMLHLYQNAV